MSDRRAAKPRKIHRFSPDIQIALRPLETAKDNYHGILALLTDLVVIAAAIAAPLLLSPWFYHFSMFVIGTRQRALATLLHESAHKVLTANRTLNFILGLVGGWLVFQSYGAYRDSHIGEHHRYLREPPDPDNASYHDQGLYEAEPDTFLRDEVMPVFLGIRIKRAATNLVRDRLMPRNWPALSFTRKAEYIVFVAFWLTLLAALAAGGLLGIFVLYWIVPFFAGFVPSNWLIELCEHFPIVERSDVDLYMTRNRLSGPIERSFFGIHGEQWHLVHHLRPSIPFWNVEKAHRLMMRDDEYAQLNRETGGILTCGPNGQPPILWTIPAQLRAWQDAHNTPSNLKEAA